MKTAVNTSGLSSGRQIFIEKTWARSRSKVPTRIFLNSGQNIILARINVRKFCWLKNPNENAVEIIWFRALFFIKNNLKGQNHTFQPYFFIKKTFKRPKRTISALFFYKKTTLKGRNARFRPYFFIKNNFKRPERTILTF